MVLFDDDDDDDDFVDILMLMFVLSEWGLKLQTTDHQNNTFAYL